MRTARKIDTPHRFVAVSNRTFHARSRKVSCATRAGGRFRLAWSLQHEPTHLDSAMANAINCYIILKGVLLPNTWTSRQHKYLKHGGREPVTSKKITLRQVVPNFTRQVVSSKILRVFRWKLWVTLCSVPLSNWP